MKGCPQQTKEKTYKAIVRPVVDYCDSIWSPHIKSYIQKIEMVQRKAARFVLNRPYRKTKRDSVTEMLQELEWKPLEERRKMHSLTLYYKVVNGLVQVPTSCLPPLAQRDTRRDLSHK